MPNCDWGRPCDCTECRTIHEDVVCSNCGFTNIVAILREVDGCKTDKHGIGYYEFSKPIEPKRILTCFKCSFKIENVNNYTNIDKTLCKLHLDREKAISNGRICFNCSKLEEQDFSSIGAEKVKLKSKNGKLLCQSCLAEVLENEIPDPSNELEKYKFNRRSLKWELKQIKRKCITCEKSSWINVENKWQKQCGPCYKKSLQSKPQKSPSRIPPNFFK